MIRNQLEDMDIDVVSIAASDLNDPEALNQGLKKIAKRIGRKDLQKKYKQIHKKIPSIFLEGIFFMYLPYYN